MCHHIKLLTARKQVLLWRTKIRFQWGNQECNKNTKCKHKRKIWSFIIWISYLDTDLSLIPGLNGVLVVAYVYTVRFNVKPQWVEQKNHSLLPPPKEVFWLHFQVEVADSSF